MKIGYVTNGLAHHRLDDAVDLLADLGYQALGLTLDAGHLDPYRCTDDEIDALRRQIERHGMALAIETGARFLLDPRRKHEPTLISPDPAGRRRRIDFYRRAIEIGEALGAPLVSIWSGRLQAGVDPRAAAEWLAIGCRSVCRLAAERGLRIAFEPEPGMLVETIDQYLTLARQVDHPALGLTIDVGHLACVETDPPAQHILRARDELIHLHLDDIADRVHRHLALGEGQIDFPPLLAALRRIDYQGLALVELSRDSHRAPEVAADALRRLRAGG